MAKILSIPDEYQNVHQRILKLLPYELQNDTDVHNITLVYLKFGGEKLARLGVEIINRRYIEELQAIEEEAQDLDDLNSDDDEDEDPDGDDDTHYSELEDLDNDDD